MSDQPVFWPDLVPDPDALPDEAEWQLGGSVDLRVGNCHTVLDTIASESVGLVMCSPPYDTLREYGGGYEFDLKELGKQVHRILRPGGVAVVVIQDQIVHGGRSLTTFRMIMDWCIFTGFTLFETLIYNRHGAPGAASRFRFRCDHEYMPVFLKGMKPAHFHPEHMASAAVNSGLSLPSGAARRMANGKVKYSKSKVTIAETTSRGTVWKYSIGQDMAAQDSRAKFIHPATYPDKLAYDHILCWTAPGDLVVDPFVGSGSTAVAALAAGRRCIGIDVNDNYIRLAKERCKVITDWQNTRRLPRRGLEPVQPA